MVNTECIGLRCLVVILLRADASDYSSPDSGERAPSYAILRFLRVRGTDSEEPEIRITELQWDASHLTGRMI